MFISSWWTISVRALISTWMVVWSAGGAYLTTPTASAALAKD
jgi:hypothetical protein